jgi:protein-disulfide isomerase
MWTCSTAVSAGGKQCAHLVGLFAVGMSLAACAAGENDDRKAGSSDAERSRVERIVHDYIIAHPEVITEAFSQREKREMARLIDTNRAVIETPFGGAWAGAKDGDVILVELFDYACGYCRASNSDIARLLVEDKKLKVVWRELPVLGEDSLAAARVSLAAAKQGRFVQFHDALFAAGAPTPANIAKAQKIAGVTSMTSGEFDNEIANNNEIARALGANGTPAFVIGGAVLHGAVGYDALKKAIADAREKKG